MNDLAGQNTGQQRPEGPARRALCLLGIGAMLALFRAPYYLTRDVQEDALITWRSAVHLADTGHYSYNLPDGDCATTTHACAFVVALTRLVFGRWFVPVVTAVNTVLLLGGTYLVAAGLFEDLRRRVLLWSMMSLTPVALQVSYSGMETSMLILAIGGAFAGLSSDRPRDRHHAALAAMPWIRPDAVAFAGLIIAAMGWKRRRVPWRALASLAVGVATLAAFNYLCFGSVLNRTITAKEIAYQPTRTVSAFAERLWLIFFGRSMFLPLASKYLFPVGPAAGVVGIALCVYAVVRSRKDRRQLARASCLAAIVLLVPTAYACGGVVFPWYLWPSELLGWALVLAVVLQWTGALTGRWRSACVVGVASLVGLAAAGQFVLSLSRGTHEYLHRAAVGRYIRAHSHPDQTIFLEPAGYIPFYARRRVYDEIGLGTPEITAYMRKYPHTWWIRFVRDKRPDFLVQRDHILQYRTLDGYRLAPPEIEWFRSNYELIREFHYRPEDHFRDPLLLRVLRLGSAHSYYVFRLKAGAATRPPGRDRQAPTPSTAPDEPTAAPPVRKGTP